MTAIAKELAEIVETLSAEKAREVVDFARFLKHQAGDAAWERIVTSETQRPKLDIFAAEAMREGISEPLDPSKM